MIDEDAIINYSTNQSQKMFVVIDSKEKRDYSSLSKLIIDNDHILMNQPIITLILNKILSPLPNIF